MRLKDSLSVFIVLIVLSSVSLRAQQAPATNQAGLTADQILDKITQTEAAFAGDVLCAEG